MIANEPLRDDIESASARVGDHGRVWTKTLLRAAKSRRGAVGLGLLVPIVLVAILGPYLASHSPTEFVTSQYGTRSAGAPLGGDGLGRDVLSRVLWGGRLLLAMSLAATIIGVGLGAIVGVSAAYFGRWVDSLLMRTVDLILAFPQLVFALLLVSLFQAKLWLIVVAVGISHVPQVARVLHGTTLSVAESDFVKSAELLGVPSRRIIFGEIAPNLVTPLMVETGLRVTYSIILMAGLSFIGLGVQPPAADWGVMINENRLGLSANPWSVLAPAILIAILTIGVNMYTDAVGRVATRVSSTQGRQSTRAVRTRLLGRAR